jgi:hypothetical protein
VAGKRYTIQMKHHGEWRKWGSLTAQNDEEAKAAFREDVHGRGRPYRLVDAQDAIVDFMKQKD